MCRSEPKPLIPTTLVAHRTQDAVLAAEAAVDGILISNHGGKLFSPTRFLLLNGQYSRSSTRIVRDNS